MDKSAIVKRCEHIKKFLNSVKQFDKEKQDILNLIENLYNYLRQITIDEATINSLVQVIENKYQEILYKTGKPDIN